MPADYITRDDFTNFKGEFATLKVEVGNLKGEFAVFREDFTQFRRDMGAMHEEVLSRFKIVGEGLMMLAEKIETFKVENAADHERYESRLSRLESKRLFRKH